MTKDESAKLKEMVQAWAHAVMGTEKRGGDRTSPLTRLLRRMAYEDAVADVRRLTEWRNKILGGSECPTPSDKP
jgi:hypothetical protein